MRRVCCITTPRILIRGLCLPLLVAMCVALAAPAQAGKLKLKVGGGAASHDLDHPRRRIPRLE